MRRIGQQAALTAKATPQAIAVALAMACLIFPANPVLPMPTVGGYAHASSDCSGLRQLVGRLQAELDAANTGGPGQNNDNVRRIAENLRSAQQGLAECETSCPFPLAVMALGFGVAGTAAGAAATIVPEPVSTSIGLLGVYYGSHAMLWGGLCLYWEYIR